MFFNQSATNVNNPESPSNPILDELMEQLRDSLGYEKFSELETKAIKHLQCAKKYETDENKQAYKELLQQANLAAIQLVCKRFDNKTFFYPTAKDIFHKSDPNTPNKPFPMDQFFTSVEGLEPSYYKDETNKTDVLEGVEKGHLRRNLTDQFYNPHSKFNPRYDVSMAFRAREGYSSWELLNELFQAPNRSAMECLGAIDLTFWLTVKYVLYLTCKPNDKNHKNNAKEKFEELDKAVFENGDLIDNEESVSVGFQKPSSNLWKKRNDQYKALMAKDLFLRRLENHLGKGTAWDEEDEDGFD